MNREEITRRLEAVQNRVYRYCVEKTGRAPLNQRLEDSIHFGFLDIVEKLPDSDYEDLGEEIGDVACAMVEEMYVADGRDLEDSFDADQQEVYSEMQSIATAVRALGKLEK